MKTINELDGYVSHLSNEICAPGGVERHLLLKERITIGLYQMFYLGAELERATAKAKFDKELTIMFDTLEGKNK